MQSFLGEAMEWLLLALYAVTFVSQIVINVVSVKKTSFNLIRINLIYEAVMAGISFALFYYYNNRPIADGSFFPGLTYFGEVIFSFCALIGFCFIFLVTILIGLIMYLKNN